MSVGKDISKKWTIILLFAAFWVPAMLAASYEWKRGEYYDYGWFVPPAALGLFIWRMRGLGEPANLPWKRWVPALFFLVPWVLLLRVLGYADPSWRMPMVLLGLTAVVASHILLWQSYGLRQSAEFVLITLLALSAIPWPTVAEQGIVDQLTYGVIHATTEWFHLSGRPVEILGDRLRLHDLTVEVTDGCSGVRSFQSFVMATWFFAELYRMRFGQVLTLLIVACLAAFVVNMSRTWALATIRFDHGVEAFDRAHDWLGLLAFLVSGTFFYLVSGFLADSKNRRKVRRVTVSRKKP